MLLKPIWQLSKTYFTTYLAGCIEYAGRLLIFLSSLLQKKIMSFSSGNSFSCFPSIETLENKTNYFPREQRLGV